jgi:hypothetical protein
MGTDFGLPQNTNFSLTSEMSVHDLFREKAYTCVVPKYKATF